MQNVQTLNTHKDNIIGITNAREELSNIVAQVQYQGNTFIISRHGKPAAAMVPVSRVAAKEQDRAKLFKLIASMQKEAQLPAQKAARLADAAVRKVRSQKSSSQ